MPMLTWTADVLDDAGLPVLEIPGWETRGHGAMAEVLGLLAHHTAGPAAGDGRRGDLVVPGYPSLAVVVDGRPGLDGPLANLGLARDGTWLIIAAGQAWHAGTGSAEWCPANQGNSHLIGIEAESMGTRDDWTPEQRESYPRGCAALLRHLCLGSYRVIGHKDWAPARKIDPAHWDMNAFRADVARWMDNPAQEDDMAAPDKEYFDERFGDLWDRLRVRTDEDGNITGDRLGDIEERIIKLADVVAELSDRLVPTEDC